MPASAAQRRGTVMPAPAAGGGNVPALGPWVSGRGRAGPRLVRTGGLSRSGFRTTGRIGRGNRRTAAARSPGGRGVGARQALGARPAGRGDVALGAGGARATGWGQVLCARLCRARTPSTHASGRDLIALVVHNQRPVSYRRESR